MENKVGSKDKTRQDKNYIKDAERVKQLWHWNQFVSDKVDKDCYGNGKQDRAAMSQQP